jgi:Aerotolerance regulator N-terminal
MSFLQPMLLAALPLVALPIIIHLINQRRYQTMRWAAMMFLLAANRMSRGYARVRQWLIMAMRMAAVAGLIFAVSRPLSGGWLGMTAGGRPDTTIVVLDRSPSMQQVGADARGSKLETGVRQLVATLETLGSSRWVLIDSNAKRPRELEKIDDLLTTPGASPASASADLPAMLLAALEYGKANKAGRTEIWICSDIRANDWNADSGRWQALRDGFAELPQGVRFHLLAYPQPAPENVSVRVTDVRRQKAGDAAELLVSLRINRERESDDRQSVPVQFEIEGARSEIMVELAGAQAELKDHRIPLEKGRDRGWGRVSIPADANPADNDFWFVFEQPAPRRSIVVVEDAPAARALELAASISPDPLVKCTAEAVSASQLAAVDWDGVSLLLWQAPLPDAAASKQVQAFVDRGGSVIFFPAHVPGAGDTFGVRWMAWESPKSETPVESWRGDEDLLAHTASGQPLPVGQLQIRKYCGLSGEVTPLATLRGGAPLLSRVTTSRGAAYFCATTPAPADSSLAANGVVFYVLIQRALASGAAALGNTRQLTAGDAHADNPTLWKRVAGAREAISTDYAYHRGVYQDGERLLAVNRAPGEASAPVLADRRVADLFKGLDFARVDDTAGSLGSLIQEIWRLFLVAMMVAMVAEAALCLPKVARPAGAVS